MNEAVIELNGVSRTFKGTLAVDDVHLSVKRGELVALLGPNGAGKTTLILMMLGLLFPTKGTVQVLQGDPHDKKVKQKVGALLQENSTIDGLLVRECINLFRSYYPRPLPLDELLHFSGLQDKATTLSTSLSGGQRRRLGFAQAIAGNPGILFLDEPTVGMDVTSRRQFWEGIKAFQKQGTTVILTTHYLEEADDVADRIVVLNKGKIVADGNSSLLKSKATSKFVKLKSTSPYPFYKWPTVTNVEEYKGFVRLYSTNTDDLLRYIFTNALSVHDIEVHSGNLNEAFEFLTQSNETKIV